MVFESQSDGHTTWEFFEGMIERMVEQTISKTFSCVV